MKRFSKYLIVVVLALFSLTRTAVFAHHEGDWQEKMRAERVAFLTTAMELTPVEAEKFWPVYNSMEAERRASFGKVMRAYKALSDGVAAGKTDKELEVLVNDYTTANKNSHSIEAKYTPQLVKVLSVSKVAKLFVAEEEFRRQQIGRWSSNKK